MKSIKASFDASLSLAAHRASKLKFQQIIPGHWFSAAASECLRMYVDGHFYGTISVSQSYIEALGKFIAECHMLKQAKNDASVMWTRLAEEGIVSSDAKIAAVAILQNRNDFHHLNKEIETDYQELETRGLDCLANLHTIESDIFSYSFVNGTISPHKPRYWPKIEGDTNRVQVQLRNL